MRANSITVATRLPIADRAWIADWRAFNAVHFSLPPERLVPLIPFPVERCRERAWVSLIWFQLCEMRFAGSGAFGRWLCRPISDHGFLNVRTYVRGNAGPGICFLAEWIPNRINCVLGPPLYGLPYRLGRFTEWRDEVDGTATLRIDDPSFDAPFGLKMPTRRDDAAPCEPGSIDEFLLERYQAYTFRRESARRFRVAHARWSPARADWVRCDLGFLRQAFPWLSHATLELAHVCGDLRAVEMGFPHAAEASWAGLSGVGGVISPRLMPEYAG